MSGTQPPLVILANDPWRSQWRRKQRLASRLAARREVYYLDPPFSALDFLRGTRSPVGWLGGRMRIDPAEGGVHVVTGTLGIPAERFFGMIGLINTRRQEAWAAHVVRELSKRHGFDEADVICYWPLLKPRRLPIVIRRLVYDALDDYAAMSRSRFLAPRIRRAMQARAAEADLTFVPDPTLYQLLRAHVRAPGALVLLPHGVDTDVFHPDAWRGTRFESLRGEGQIKAVFHGTLNGRIDLEALRALLRAGVTLLLAGEREWPARNLPALRKEGDLRDFGLISVREAGALVAAADVGIIPYRPIPGVSSINNLKLREFLAAGLPVVACRPMAAGRGGALEEERAGIQLAEDPESFAAAVVQAGRMRREGRREPSADPQVQDWSVIVERFERALGG